jgi:ADP-L-glycero-D-manno-heptose 6-epimerase
MIIVTGAAGFIGSCIISKLNREGYHDLVLVDDFSRADKFANYENKRFSRQVDRNAFFEWILGKEHLVQFIIHMGARTDTTEQNVAVFDRLNLHFSQQIWNLCVAHSVPLIYASSAATYGGGELGFEDKHEIITDLAPLNPYGRSKNDFDIWALEQSESPFFWAGLKFFNVYGPNEYHKGRMASVVFHAFNQINETGGMKLFRSHREGIADGEQKRDFVFVEDVCEVVWFLMNERKHSGLFNLGTGEARSFLDLTKAVFKAMNREEKISFIDTPEDIRDTYQYFTEAPMDKLKEAGYSKPFTSLEDGIYRYVDKFLLSHEYL